MSEAIMVYVEYKDGRNDLCNSRTYKGVLEVIESPNAVMLVFERNPQTDTPKDYVYLYQHAIRKLHIQNNTGESRSFNALSRQ